MMMMPLMALVTLIRGGVQGGGDIPDHLPAQEGGQHEHRKVGDEGFRRVEANGDTGGTEENPPENLADSAFLFLFYFRSSNGFRVYLLRLRCWGLRFWGRPDYLAIMDDGGGANHFIVKVDVEVFGTPEIAQQVVEVVAVELAGLGGHAAGQICQADDGDAVVVADFSRLGDFAVAPLFCRQVHYHRTGLHAFHHFAGDQQGRFFAGDSTPW